MHGSHCGVLRSVALLPLFMDAFLVYLNGRPLGQALVNSELSRPPHEQFCPRSASRKMWRTTRGTVRYVSRRLVRAGSTLQCVWTVPVPLALQCTWPCPHFSLGMLTRHFVTTASGQIGVLQLQSAVMEFRVKKMDDLTSGTGGFSQASHGSRASQPGQSDPHSRMRHGSGQTHSLPMANKSDFEEIVARLASAVLQVCDSAAWS